MLCASVRRRLGMLCARMVVWTLLVAVLWWYVVIMWVRNWHSLLFCFTPILIWKWWENDGRYHHPAIKILSWNISYDRTLSWNILSVKILSWNILPVLVKKLAAHMMLHIQPSRNRKVVRNCSSATQLLTQITCHLSPAEGRNRLQHSTEIPEMNVPGNRSESLPRTYNQPI